MHPSIIHSEQPLTQQEETLFAELEAVIEANMKGFVLVGMALAKIRDQRLYRIQYPTFEDYLLRAQLHLLSLGITCVHDFDRWEHLDTLFRLEASGQLKLKVFKSLPAESLDRILRENLRQVLEADQSPAS